jgi:hypothetical protein
VYRAQLLVHNDLPAATDALLHSSVPDLDRQHVERLLEIYQFAVPETPEVSVAGITRAVEAYPANDTPPDLTDLNLADFIAPEFAAEAIATVR